MHSKVSIEHNHVIEFIIACCISVLTNRLGAIGENVSNMRLNEVNKNNFILTR